ncbi:putative aminopeptidase-2 [Microplitis mediator]|uniref:putative aminopeptidase-2 n=1 Tax=Microplitis mediator TaxID=375433 RepID=UPI0025545F30|nr:putative aminopeptidase-2 [Microplitis mediator]
MSDPNYRLPFETKLSNFVNGHDVVLRHYKIKLAPYIQENEFTFDGEVAIDFENLKPRNSFKLNAKNLEAVENVILKKENEVYESSDYTVTIDSTDNILIINFDREIAVGVYNLYVQYKGQVRESTKVLKHASYFDKSGKRQWMLLSDFEIDGIQELFPSWRADCCHTKFEFSIKHNREYTALSNAPVKETITAENSDLVWTIFEKTPTFSPNHFAFIVGNLECLSAHDDPFKMWLPKNTIDYQNNDIKIVEKLWKALEDVTGITHKEHKYNKLDVVVLPEFIEIKQRNWGLCIVNHVSIGWKENIDKTEKITTITNIATSFIDHWFGGLIQSVTSGRGRPFSYGLRHYLAQLIVDKVDKTFHSIDRLINRQGQEGNWDKFHYDYISRTIENVLGKDNFRAALRNYILHNESKDQIVSQLSDEIVEASGDMKEFMKKVLKNWNYFSSFPTLTVTRNYEANKAIVNQARFLNMPESDWRYWVPLNWATQDEPNFEDTSVSQWYDGDFMKTEIPVTVAGDRWIILNKQHFGTYRVNYDEKNWKLIINYLKTDDYSKIHLFNRIQLINDAFTIADWGFLDYSIPFELSEYLTRETEFAPWAAFLHKINQLYYDSSLHISPYFDNFKKYVLKLTAELEKRILLADEANDDFTTRLLRVPLMNLHCIFGSSDWGNYALTKLKNWLDDPDKYPIFSEMKVVILNNGIRFADEDTWNKLWEKYILNLRDPKNQITSPYNRSRYEFVKEEELLYALCCILNKEVIKKFVILVMENVIEDIIIPEFFEKLCRLNEKTVDALLDIESNSTKADGTPLLDEYFRYDAVDSLVDFVRTDDQLQRLKLLSSQGNTLIDAGRISYPIMLTTHSKIRLNVFTKILIYGIIIPSIVSARSETYDSPSLPDHTIPTHYTIKLAPNIQDKTNLSFDGESFIDIQIKTDIKVLTLNAKNIRINGDIILTNETLTIIFKDYLLDPKNDLLEIKFNDKISKGNYTLHISYSGKINTDSIEGLIYSTYDDKSDEKQWLLLTNFDDNNARQIMPCWDDPHLTATFEISVQHDRKYTALSNTQYDSIISVKNKFNYIWTSFERTPRLSIRSVAFVLGDLEYLSDDSNAYRVWTSKNSKNHRNFFATVGGKGWKAMEDITGITYDEYDLKKVDIVVIPTENRWKMLFWGLSVISKKDIPYDSYGNNNRVVKFLVSLSQLLYDQWILNADITLDNFDNSFLNYDLRIYVSVCMADQIEQTWDVKERYFRSQLDNPNRPGVVSRTVANIFGKDKFRKALRSYIKDNKFGANSSVDLIDEYAKISGSMNTTFKKALSNWMTTLGYPIIFVSRNYTTDRALITQERFMKKAYVSPQYKYWVPINCATEDNHNFDDLTDIHWFDPDMSSLEIPAAPENRWIICNKRKFGDYRVNYDKNNWKLIIEYLKNDNYSVIHPLNRAQLIDDAFTLADGAYIGYDIPLELMGYLKRETDYHPWAEFWRQLEYLYYNSPLRTCHFYDAFKSYVLEQTTALERTVLTDDMSNGDDHYMTKLQRASLLKWTCRFDSSFCTNYASEKLTQWLENHIKNPIDEFYMPVILCSGIRGSNKDTWNQLYRKFIVDKDDNILRALGCTSNLNILKTFLMLVFNNMLQSSNDFDDLSKIFDIVANENDAGIDVILDVLLEIQKKYDDSDIRYEFVHIGVFALQSIIKKSHQLEKFKTILNNDAARISHDAMLKKINFAENNIHMVNLHSQFLVEFFSHK